MGEHRGLIDSRRERFWIRVCLSLHRPAGLVSLKSFTIYADRHCRRCSLSRLAGCYRNSDSRGGLRILRALSASSRARLALRMTVHKSSYVGRRYDLACIYGLALHSSRNEEDPVESMGFFFSLLASNPSRALIHSIERPRGNRAKHRQSHGEVGERERERADVRRRCLGSYAPRLGSERRIPR